ncbi:glutamine amidotransferase [Candidatus Daviesbacteria bacterium]|nr:glutamine amidotransferase [Candidatus Daviesbacteria bacterium]
MNLTIGYLYGECMNIYGDTGNIITLQKRAQWRKISVRVKNISIGDRLKLGEVDIFFFGGGQDQAQQLVSEDLQKGTGEIIKAEVERGIPLLSICGGYQLLGAYYQPHKGPKLAGIDLFPAYTQASSQRMIGNIVVQLTSELADQLASSNSLTRQSANSLLIGFENHSGKTYLDEKAKPLGKIIKGFGNNGEDKTEGCIYKNAIGCYMHGSLLPKNPQLADWLLQKALEVKYSKEMNLMPLNDSFEKTAHNKTISRFS